MLCYSAVPLIRPTCSIAMQLNMKNDSPKHDNEISINLIFWLCQKNSGILREMYVGQKGVTYVEKGRLR